MNKKNNKGFSLVELIVVIAIMAVLVGVLAPSLLRYVEKSRIQKDISAISEVEEAVKIACADETVNKAVADVSNGMAIEITGTKTLGGTSADALETEVAKTISEVKLTSNGLKGATVKVTAKVVDSAVTVTVSATNVDGDTALAAFKSAFGDSSATAK